MGTKQLLARNQRKHVVSFAPKTLLKRPRSDQGTVNCRRQKVSYKNPAVEWHLES